MVKICFKCKQSLSCDNFSKSSNTKDGLHSYCRICQSQYAKLQKLKPKKEPIPEGYRYCRTCSKIKLLEDFAKNSHKKLTGRRYKCKICGALQHKKWAAVNQDKIKEYRKRHYSENKNRLNAARAEHLRKPENREKRSVRSRQKLYGVSPEQYDRMISEQNGVCALCGQLNPSGKPLFVDHNHKTGETRKLLCHKCNAGIGLFGENIALLEKVICYLKGFSLGGSKSDTFTR